jgi:hypothetical protein
MSKKTVVTSLPDCDICQVVKNPPTIAHADCFIPSYGTWGNVCKQHFVTEGCSLGTGKGQVFELQEPNHTPQSQTERIKEALATADLNTMSMEDMEDIFEDRDPMEFL